MQNISFNSKRTVYLLCRKGIVRLAKRHDLLMKQQLTNDKSPFYFLKQ